jgi:hypothetical protein
MIVDKSVADRQAYWLEKVLAEEHKRDKKHAKVIAILLSVTYHNETTYGS